MADTETDHIDLDAPVEVADKPRKPSAYERELRGENAAYRVRAKEAAAAAEAAVAAAKADADKRVADAMSAAEQRVIRAELKASALKAGMLDLDGLKLLDLSKMVLDENGNVTGADALFEAAAKDKPWLFKATPASTSSTQLAPKATPAVDKAVSEMTPAEIVALRAKLARM